MTNPNDMSGIDDETRGDLSKIAETARADSISESAMREIIAECAERRGWPSTARNVREDNVFSGLIEIGNVFAAMREVHLRAAAPAPREGGGVETIPWEPIARAAVEFHRSLMSDWAAPRRESVATMKLSDKLNDAYMPHWPLVAEGE